MNDDRLTALIPERRAPLTHGRIRRGEPAENLPKEHEIATCAYYRWVANGRPRGTEREDWFAAREFLRHHPVQMREAAELAARATRA
jgi:hypothetical protein